MNKLLPYAGSAAGVVLIAFGIGAVYGVALLLAGLGFAVLTVTPLVPATKLDRSRAQAPSGCDRVRLSRFPGCA